MLWNELLRKGNVSLLQSQSDTQYCVCSNYNPEVKEGSQYDGGIYFCYWNDIEQKAYFLSVALENFRIKTEENYIPRPRLEELAKKFKDELDELIQYDENSERVFFDEFCEMTDKEKEWFGISKSEED